MAQEDVGQPVQDFLAQNSIQKVYVFGVAGESFAVINKDKLSADIKRKYPDASASGIGALDWEGKAFEKLKARGPITPDVQQAMNDYISVLQLAKTLRPNVKWGFYGIPFTTYYNRDAKWKQSCSKVMLCLYCSSVMFFSHHCIHFIKMIRKVLMRIMPEITF
jgi:hypothetical protein